MSSVVRYCRELVWETGIAVALLEKFTSKLVITPDSEEGGVITPDFTTPVKGAKIRL